MEKIQWKGNVFKPNVLKHTSGKEVGGTRDRRRERGSGDAEREGRSLEWLVAVWRA